MGYRKFEDILLNCIWRPKWQKVQMKKKKEIASSEKNYFLMTRLPYGQQLIITAKSLTKGPRRCTIHSNAQVSQENSS